MQTKPGTLVHTYSIVARDPVTGELGVAVQSHWFGVGTKVPWAQAGVGAIATQSFINTSFGPKGLELLAAGHSAKEVVAKLIAKDEGRDFRQLAVIDKQGRAAAFTGAKCVAEAGHYVGDNFSVQANLMLSDTVWGAMARTFERTTGPLAERMVAVLKAAQAEGGDIRGKQSAAMVVVRGHPTGQSWKDRLVDLRIDDHPQPVAELERLLRIHRAYEYMDNAEQHLEANQVAAALQAYHTATALYPHNPEPQFWYALALAQTGRVHEALPIFSDVFGQDNQWATVVKRLVEAGVVKLEADTLARILAQ